MKKIDYSLKSHILDTGLYDLYKSFRKSLYNEYTLINNPFYTSNEIELSIFNRSHFKACNYITTHVLMKFKQLYNDHDRRLLEECAKLYNAEQQRKRRLKRKIDIMLEKPCLFLTMTFSNDYLKRTTDSTRRQQITRFLKQFNTPFIANKDFGTDKIYIDKKGIERTATKREHYHGIIQLDYIDHKLYKFGQHFKAKKIIVDKNLVTSQKIGNYIAKLTNHSIKETCKRSALIYSREKKCKNIEKNV